MRLAQMQWPINSERDHPMGFKVILRSNSLATEFTGNSTIQCSIGIHEKIFGMYMYIIYFST